MSETEPMQIEESWKVALKDELQKPYFLKISEYLNTENAAGKTIYPPGPLIFNAFNNVPLDEIKVVILGQDPYHNPGEAHGLSFSVPHGIKIPPSLKKIYKELETDIAGFKSPDHGCLEHWAKQGVFMLNAFLTVEASKPQSHQRVGWENFTDAVIKTISDRREGVAFMLWGNFAKKKALLIDASKHLILEAAHPSPLAGNAFLGCNHFSKANNYLKNNLKDEINWNLSL